MSIIITMPIDSNHSHIYDDYKSYDGYVYFCGHVDSDCCDDNDGGAYDDWFDLVDSVD